MSREERAKRHEQTQGQIDIAKRFYGTKPEEWRRHRDGGWIHADAKFPLGEDKCSIGPLGVVRGGVVSGGEVSGGVVSGGEDIAKSHGELAWYRKHVKPILPWFIKQSKELFHGQKVEDK